MAIPEISSYLPSYASKPTIGGPIAPVSPSSFLPKRSIEYVKGCDGAENFQLGPSSSAIVLDQDQNVFWVIATDQNGAKTLVKGYNIGSEYVPPKPVTLEDLMAQMQSMNERLNKMEDASNGQSNYRSPVQSKPNGPNAGIRESHSVGKSAANADAKRPENGEGS